MSASRNNDLEIGRPTDALMPVRIDAFRFVGKPPIVAVVDLTLGRAQEIYGVMVMAKESRCWCAFPAIPLIGRDDMVMRDDRGKVRYKAALKWADRVTADRFTASVLDAITRQYGENALNGAAS